MVESIKTYDLSPKISLLLIECAHINYASDILLPQIFFFAHILDTICDMVRMVYWRNALAHAISNEKAYNRIIDTQLALPGKRVSIVKCFVA